MSNLIVGLVLKFFRGRGAERNMAVALADDANDYGEGIEASIPQLSRSAGCDERTARRMVRKLEDDKWLECVQASTGGRGLSAIYRISADWVRDAALRLAAEGVKPADDAAPETRAKPGRNGGKVPGFSDRKGGQETRVSTGNGGGLPGFDAPAREANNGAHLIVKNTTTLKPSSSPTETPSDRNPPPNKGGRPKREFTQDDLVTVDWMHERVRKVYPMVKALTDVQRGKWAHEIRLMREQDGRTHNEICAMFDWANKDSFWRANVRSPVKLREKWEDLAVRRSEQAARQGGSPAGASESDPRCEHVHEGGTRCEANWTMQIGIGKTRCCDRHGEELKRHLGID